MRYINESLTQSEKVVYASRPHWIVFGPAVISFIAALFIWYYLPQYYTYDPVIWRGMHFNQLMALVVGGYAIYTILQASIFYATSEYGITDKRIIMKRGWIRRDAAEIFLNRVEAINVTQSVLGRLLNYGTVIVIGVGGSADFYSNVPDPIRFRRLVQRQLYHKREM